VRDPQGIAIGSLFMPSTIPFSNLDFAWRKADPRSALDKPRTVGADSENAWKYLGTHWTP